MGIPSMHAMLGVTAWRHAAAALFVVVISARSHAVQITPDMWRPSQGRVLKQLQPQPPLQSSTSTPSTTPTPASPFPASNIPGISTIRAQSILYTPEAIAAREQAARVAAAAAGLPENVTAALVTAARASQVNPGDAGSAENTTVQGLLPWPASDQAQITLPPAGGSVSYWGQPGSSSITQGQAAPAQQATTNASSPSSPSRCCAMLASIGFVSNVPVMIVDTHSLIIPIRTNIDAMVCTCGAPGGNDYLGQASVKWRGSSSPVQMVRKSLGVTIRGTPVASNSTDGGGSKAKGRAADFPLMGMPPGKDWVLFADDDDLTLGMRNALAYDLIKRMGRWAATSLYSEVFLIQDGSPALAPSHYWGAYLVTEKVELSPDRIPIKPVSLKHMHKKQKKKVQAQSGEAATDLSGGYLFGYERDVWPGDVRITPGTLPPSLSLSPSALVLDDGRNLTFVLHEPDLKEVNKLQQGLGGPTNQSMVLAWAASYLGSVQAALVNDTVPSLPAGSNASIDSSATYSPSSLSQAPGVGGWRALVDEGAFIDYLLSLEVPKNPDEGRGSVYMTKAPGGPLVLGPPWDFNEAWGLCCGYPIEGYQNGGQSNGSSGGSAISPGGWRFNICEEPARCVKDPLDGINLWYRAVWKREPAFQLAVAQRWAALRGRNASASGISDAPLSDAWFKQRFNNYRTQLAFAAPRTYIRWRRALVPGAASAADLHAAYDAAVAGMETWALARLAWLDAELSRVGGAAQQGVQGTPGAAPLPPSTGAAIMGAAVLRANTAAAGAAVPAASSTSVPASNGAAVTPPSAGSPPASSGAPTVQSNGVPSGWLQTLTQSVHGQG